MPQDITSPTVVPFPRDLTLVLRSRIRETIELVFGEELEAALGAGRSERVADRTGARNGSVTRCVTTQAWPARVDDSTGSRLPGGWLDDGVALGVGRSLSTSDDAHRRGSGGLLLSQSEYATDPEGAGTAVRREEPLEERDLEDRDAAQGGVFTVAEPGSSEEPCAILYFDGFHLPVRVARRVVRVPVLAVIGVRHSDGRKILLSLSIARSESTASWSSVVEDLVRRGLPPPALVVLDGNAGLLRSIREGWPKSRIQRCTKHKLENLRSKAPKHSHEELKRDYDAIIYANDLSEAKRSHHAFVRKWRLLSNEVSRSLEEAGEDLLSFYSFPPSQWKCLRTTNPLEAVNPGFRRRTKTQGAFPNEDAALVLLYGLVAADQIHLKAIDGWKHLAEVKMPGLQQAA